MNNSSRYVDVTIYNFYNSFHPKNKQSEMSKEITRTAKYRHQIKRQGKVVSQQS